VSHYLSFKSLLTFFALVVLLMFVALDDDGGPGQWDKKIYAHHMAHLTEYLLKARGSRAVPVEGSRRTSRYSVPVEGSRRTSGHFLFDTSQEAISTFLEGKKTNAKHSQIQEQTCVVLREFARGNDVMKATIRKIGGIDAIVHALVWLQPLTFNEAVPTHNYR
jgi:hypothetical protein